MTIFLALAVPAVGIAAVGWSVAPFVSTPTIVAKDIEASSGPAHVADGYPRAE